MTGRVDRSRAGAVRIGMLWAHDVAMVVADSAGTWPYFEEATAGFDNDAKVHAPYDAIALVERLDTS